VIPSPSTKSGRKTGHPTHPTPTSAISTIREMITLSVVGYDRIVQRSSEENPLSETNITQRRCPSYQSCRGTKRGWLDRAEGREYLVRAQRSRIRESHLHRRPFDGIARGEPMAVPESVDDGGLRSIAESSQSAGNLIEQW
jgi:hypothetical protein